MSVYLDVSTETLREMMLRMLRIRRFDEQATLLRNKFIPGFLHNSVGQEAEIVGACMALRRDDFMTGNHRSHGHPIGKGAPLAPLMAELLGRSTGVCKGKGGSMHLAVFDVGSLGESGIVGASMPTAVGAALSAQLRGTDQVCLAFFGDGAANCGPFHESLNLASVWKLPVIFLCENNGYASCSPQAQTTSVTDIASRAVSYNIPGVVVDGQDVLAVYTAVSEAVDRAREGKGPSLIETKTYRFCDHMEEDEVVPYRDAAEVQEWRKRDPLALFARYLEDSELITRPLIEGLEGQVTAEVEDAIAFALASPLPDPKSLLEHVFA